MADLSNYKRFAHLINVDENANSNKFYDIYENFDGSLDIKYGRIGSSEVEKHYPVGVKDFDSLKWNKEQKGYVDRSAAVATREAVVASDKNGLPYKEIENKEIKELFDLLVSSAREFMEKNYTISVQEITQKMLQMAEDDINELVDIANDNPACAMSRFKSKLTELFTDAPRKMAKVNEFMPKSSDDFEDIINRERGMLNNLKGIYEQRKKNLELSKKDSSADMTILEANGLTVRQVTFSEEDRILSHLGRDYQNQSVERRYIRAFAVENSETRKHYERFKAAHGVNPKDVKLFYHGSKVENWYSIMRQGLSLNPNARVTGKMFGNGLYFASECRKSLNYMDTKGSRWNDGQRESGFTAIYAVALGKCYKTDSPLSSSFGYADVQALGCDSVFAQKGKHLLNDEYIVYDQSQCTIKYLVEFASPYAKELHFNLDRDCIRNHICKGFNTLVKHKNGVIAELDLSSLNIITENAFLERFSGDDASCSKYMFLYDEEFKELSIIGAAADGKQTVLSPNFTGNDYKFLLREMKKTFCRSENDWEEMIQASHTLKEGEIITQLSERSESKPRKSRHSNHNRNKQENTLDM